MFVSLVRVGGDPYNHMRPHPRRNTTAQVWGTDLNLSNRGPSSQPKVGLDFHVQYWTESGNRNRYKELHRAPRS